MKRECGVKFFRFGGKNGLVQLKNGTGVLYLTNSIPCKAFRINYEQGEINSITIWNAYLLNKPGDFTVDFKGIGLLDAGKKLIDVIQQPRAGDVSLNEDYESLNEAKRVSLEKFGELVLQNLGDPSEMQNLSWETIENIASSFDVTVPTAVRKMKKSSKRGRGGRTTYDLSPLVGVGPMPDVSTGKKANNTKGAYDVEDRSLYLKITARDNKSNKFTSIDGDEEARDIMDTVKDALQAKNFKKEYTDPDTLFGDLASLTKLVCRGVRNSLVVYGGPGIGKSWTVKTVLGEEGFGFENPKGKSWVLIKGKVTTAELYKTLFYQKDANKIIVLDDTDNIWKDADAMNIMKAALDSYPERVVSWSSSRTLNVSRMSPEEKLDYEKQVFDELDSDPESKVKLPSQFTYRGRCIFLSNLKVEEFDDAVMNRSMKIDMTISQKEIFKRLEKMIDEIGDKNAPKAIKLEVLGFLKDELEKKNMSYVSFRTFADTVGLAMSGVDTWRQLVKYS